MSYRRLPLAERARDSVAGGDSALGGDADGQGEGHVVGNFLKRSILRYFMSSSNGPAEEKGAQREIFKGS